MLEILAIVLPVFLVLGLGFGLGRAGFLDRGAEAALSRLVFYVAAPALLLRSTARTPIHEAFQPRVLLVTAGVSLLVAMVTYWLTARSAPGRRGVLAQGAHRSNMVFFGVPVILNAFGESVLGRAAVVIGFMVVVYNFLAVALLILPHRDTGLTNGRRWGRAAREVIRNPLILACAAGLLLSAARTPLPLALDRGLAMVGQIASPLALIAIGAGLDLRRLRADLGPALLISLIKLIVYPALIYLGLELAGTDTLDRQVIVLVMAAPTAVVSSIMAREMKGDQALADAIVIGTTLASLATTAAWLGFFRMAG